MAFLSRPLASTLVALALALAGAGACFAPRQPSCAFSCVDDGICPSGYSCAADGICHRDDGVGTCDLPAQTDGPPADTGSDAGSDAESDASADAGAN